MTERMMQLLPEYYKLIEDFRQLDHTETSELDDLQRAVDQLFSDQFVMSSSLQAVKRREQMLGILANSAIETLNFRRRRIMNRYQTKPPFTIQYLQQQLDRLVGIGLTLVNVNPHTFVLTVTANIENASVFREVLYTVETVKPANLFYQQNTPLENIVELEEQISMRAVTWNYKLNSIWQLGTKPFVSYGTEVVVK
jgi:hypothetical protein